MAEWLFTEAADFETRFGAFLSAKREQAAEVDVAVAAIIADVRSSGNRAVIAHTELFDGHRLGADQMRLTRAEIRDAVYACAGEVLQSLDFAAGRIRDYHERQRPNDETYEDTAGVLLGHRWTAIEAVGIYVPGGKASYPSSVLMNAIPAKVAGVKRLAMTVPAPQGALSVLATAAAHISGIEEIYRIGGAQAVAALAFGTETIEPVAKIVGPGNAYVAAAKRMVFGQVGIDMIAGPSEVLVLADASNDPKWTAIDLLAQAEHDESAQAILVTDDEDFAHAVEDEVNSHLATLPRQDIARQSWQQFGAIFIVSNLAAATRLIDRIAPEQLQICAKDADTLCSMVRNAGAIFLGSSTPEAIGDYVGGPNHVLPTGRSARFSSGLGVVDFMKRTSILKTGSEALPELGRHAIRLARAEGLEAHARSIAIRLNQP
ncbi:MAG: histidinol dehydrogenase [Aestuariivirgaceae bacterium]